ncbi:MAG: undecaprenyldiphospho-muramoylpentapeptide beta-N-acetylglucosaminyltransferase [Candidatus Caldatribacteriaceae bacterium]
MKPCIFVAGGGTGGHVFPSLCIASEIQKKANWDVIFLGTKRGIEREVVQEQGFRTVYLTARGWNRKLDKNFLRLWGENFWGFLLVGYYFLRYRPVAFLAMGSYLSLLGGIWARLLGVPIYVHEQNIYPGLANRIISRWASKIFVVASEVGLYLPHGVKVEVVGNPLRKEVTDWKGRKEEAQRMLGLQPGYSTILVMGGSKGSEVINQNFLQAMNFFAQNDIQVIHLAGKENFPYVREMARKFPFPYLVYPFLPSPGLAYAASDLAICRAGANTVFELFFFGLPSILIPYAEATESHQMYNALWLQKHQPVEIIEERNLSPQVLVDKILKLLRMEKFDSKEAQHLLNSASLIAQKIVGEILGKGEKAIG